MNTLRNERQALLGVSPRAKTRDLPRRCAEIPRPWLGMTREKFSGLFLQKKPPQLRPSTFVEVFLREIRPASYHQASAWKPHVAPLVEAPNGPAWPPAI